MSRTRGPRSAPPVRYRWRIAIVEDHLLQRQRTEELIIAQSGLQVVWSGETLPAFLAWLATSPPDRRPHLLILDLMVERGPSVDPDQVRELVRSGTRVLVLSAMSSAELVRKVLRAGVAGFVGKRDSEEDIVAAIWTVLGRGQWLTPELASVIAGDGDRPQLSDQEERALVLYASGLTLDAVARAIGVQRDTAKKYLARVKAKYAAVGRDVRTKIDLNQAAQRDGYLDGPLSES
ncbi:response regulator [Nocardioides caeni]|uniref:response regulator transcription factor n=1 Tax=Nocardioides caeni TaxID=574700 RepID=UPI00130531F5|nr:response regulator transcription factor [Nocardioides caeni]